MVAEARFRQTATIVEVANSGGGSAISANSHHRQSRKRWWRKPISLKLPPSPQPQLMVAEARFGPTATITQAENDGGGSPFSANRHHHSSRKRWWRKRDFSKPPPSPTIKTMVAEARFQQTTTITQAENDGGGSAISAIRHHRYRRKSQAPQQFCLQNNPCPLSPPSRPVREPPLRRAGSKSSADAAPRRSERRAGGTAWSSERRAGGAAWAFSLIPPVHPQSNRYSESYLSGVCRW